MVLRPAAEVMTPWKTWDAAFDALGSTAVLEQLLSEAAFRRLRDAAASLDRSSLLAAVLPPGRVVLICGLVDAPHGAHGRVEGAPSGELIAVRVPGHGDVMPVHWRHLGAGCHSGALVVADVATIILSLLPQEGQGCYPLVCRAWHAAWRSADHLSHERSLCRSGEGPGHLRCAPLIALPTFPQHPGPPVLRQLLHPRTACTSLHLPPPPFTSVHPPTPPAVPSRMVLLPDGNLCVVQPRAERLVTSALRPVRGHRPMRPPGGSKGLDRSHATRSAASAAWKLAAAFSAARLSRPPR